LARWNFTGGNFEEIPARTAAEHSETRFPRGLATDIAKGFATDAEACDRSEALALRAIMMVRRAERAMTLRNTAGWFAGFALTEFVRDELVMRIGGRVDVYTGLAGVYRVAKEALSRLDNGADSGVRRFDAMRVYIRESMIASATASFMDVATVADRADAALDALHGSSLGAISQMLAEFDSALAKTRRGAARGMTRALGKSCYYDWANRADVVVGKLGLMRTGFAGLTAYALHGTLVIRLPRCVVAMSVSDLGRFHQLFAGACSGLIAVAAQATFAPGAERMKMRELLWAYKTQVQTIVLWGSRCVRNDEVLVCKAAKRAYGAYLGELAGELCSTETAVLWAEAEATATRVVAPSELRTYIEVASTWSAGTSLNLAKVFKLCPAPDACPGTTVLDRYAQVTNANSMDPSIAAEFTAEHRDQMLRAYIRMPGVQLALRNPASPPRWLDAYRHRDFDNVPSSEIHANLMWEGTATMPARSSLNPGVWKDSGLGWDSVEEAFNPMRPRRNGNMLLRMVFDRTCPMPDAVHVGVLHDHKIDTKPEGHKDPSRGIYSGNIRDRQNQSSMEESVEAVARFHPAYMIGADTTQREERARATLARPVNPDMRVLLYSFDVKGWSPLMPGEPQRISHDFWATLYDADVFRMAHMINEGARVYMNKAGYQCWFRNPSANFEGYNGKEMTCVLITLLSLSVRRWRAKIVAAKLVTVREADKMAAILLAYIDDGLARLDLPALKALVLFDVFKVTVIDTFALCGYTVEVSKCYPSDRLFVFLNEIYLAGRHVVHGTRAAMTICSENIEPHMTLVERVDAASAGCRGAVVAGLDAPAASFLQAYHAWMHIVEWVTKPDPVLAAIWSFAPRACGGLGLPVALQLGTSGGGAALAEGMRNLREYAKVNTTARRVYISCVRAGLDTRTAASIMASPLGGSIGAGVMTESRVPAAVRDALTALHRTGSLSQLAHQFLKYSDFRSFEEFATALIPVGQRTVIQKQVIDDASATHPHMIFTAFAKRLEKSSTLAQLIRPHKMAQLLSANRIDARASWEVLRTRALEQ